MVTGKWQTGWLSWLLPNLASWVWSPSERIWVSPYPIGKAWSPSPIGKRTQSIEKLSDLATKNGTPPFGFVLRGWSVSTAFNQSIKYVPGLAAVQIGRASCRERV